MPVEIIDLLSSPEPAFATKLSRKSPVPQPKQQPSTTTRVPTKYAADSCFTLSSDDEGDSSLPPLAMIRNLPPPSRAEFGEGVRARTNTSIRSKSSTSLHKMTAQSEHIEKRNDDFIFMSDDFDSTIDLDHSVNIPPSKNVGILGLNRAQMEKERLARNNSNKNEARELLSKKMEVSVQQAPESMLLRLGSEDPLGSLDGCSNNRESSTCLPCEVQPSGSKSDSDTTNLIKRKAPDVLLLNSEDDPFDIDLPLPKRQQLSPKHLVQASGPKSFVYKRSVSNFDTYSNTSSMKIKAPGLARSKSMIIESDPIIFTSSPDYHAEAAIRRMKKTLPTLDEDDDVFGLNLPKRSSEANWPDRNVNLDNSSDSLPDIDDMVSKNVATKARNIENSHLKTSDVLENYHANKQRDRKAQEKAKEKTQKARDKDQKIKEKEDEKERKRMLKEAKTREKESSAFLAKANILKVDKKVSTPEMIVGLPSSLKQKVRDATCTFLHDLSVKTYDYESELPVIKWKRKLEAVWDQEARIFRPCELQIKEENHVMYVMAAEEFVQLATGQEGNNLDCHVLRLKTSFISHQIIYLIEGLGIWMRKNKNLKNRGFTEAVRNELNLADLSTSQKARKKKATQYVDEDLVEHALLKLQVMHGVLIHHSQVMENTPEWIRSFTQHISTIPYKYVHRNLLSPPFVTFSKHSQDATTIHGHVILHGIWPGPGRQRCTRYVR